MSTTAPVGDLLRGWRERRRLSQLELAGRSGVSTRHLSFVETGRSRPTSAMILRLSEQLDVPLRDQNRLLLAGGFAPAHPRHDLAGPALAAVNEAVERVLAAHAPYPALVVDAGWDLVAANDALYALVADAAPALLEPPVNVVRLSLHPDGLAGRILNLGEWRAHLVGRLRRELAGTGDERLADLLQEVEGYPRPPDGAVESEAAGPTADGDALVVPLRLRLGDETLSLFSTTTVFGTPREVTVSELAIESFYPADARSRELLAGPAAAAH